MTPECSVTQLLLPLIHSGEVTSPAPRVTRGLLVQPDPYPEAFRGGCIERAWVTPVSYSHRFLPDVAVAGSGTSS